MSNFQKENRYIVIKRKHLDLLTDEAKEELGNILTAIDISRQPDIDTPAPNFECAVVERDWPEYECVWGMIQARIENPELANVAPLVLYCNNEEDRQDLIAAINLAKPGMIAKSVPDQQPNAKG